MNNWTKEPWHVGCWSLESSEGPEDVTHYIHAPHISQSLSETVLGEIRNNVDAHRIVQCVNACAGLADPGEALRKAEKALRHARWLIGNEIGTTRDEFREICEAQNNLRPGRYLDADGKESEKTNED